MILDVLRLEEENKILRGTTSADSKDAKKLAQAGNAGEIAHYKNELAKRDKDIETLKKQSQGLSDEYHRLGDQVSGGSSQGIKKDN